MPIHFHHLVRHSRSPTLFAHAQMPISCLMPYVSGVSLEKVQRVRMKLQEQEELAGEK